MLATAKAVYSLEQDRPLSAAEQQLISTTFKSQYVPQIQCWALVSDAKKKRKFFDFLNMTGSSKQSRPTTSLAGRPSGDFMIHTASCQINLNMSFSGRPCTRKINRDRFASTGVGQIFQEEPVLRKLDKVATPDKNPNSLAKFIAKKLMNPHIAEKFLSIADANIELLQELSRWVEKKNTNPLPVDNLKNHPTLSQVKERKMNHHVNGEDHLIRQQGPPLPHRVPSQSMSYKSKWTTPKTAYTDFFYDNNNRNERMYISVPFTPIEQSQPFCKFPHENVKAKTRSLTNPVFAMQAKEDTIAGRNYKRIFESPTVL